MERLTWSTDGAEEDCIVLLKLLEPAFRDILPRLLVRLGTPVVIRELEVK